jgi:hypothetical protein
MQPPLRLFFGVIVWSFDFLVNGGEQVELLDSEVGVGKTRSLDSVVWGGEQRNAVYLQSILARYE